MEYAQRVLWLWMMMALALIMAVASATNVSRLAEHLLSCPALLDGDTDESCSHSANVFAERLPLLLRVDCKRVFSERIAQRCEKVKSVSYQQLFTDYMLKNR